MNTPHLTHLRRDNPRNPVYIVVMIQFASLIRMLLPLLVLALSALAAAADIDRFVGTFSGSAEFLVDGEPQNRDLGVVIAKSEGGFEVTWTSVTFRSDGRTKERAYTIAFTPSSRDNIYQSAMKPNLFGKSVPLDPLEGEPFVWARFEEDTLSVFSLFIDESGEYEVQEFHRTLVPEGLDLVFMRLRNGAVEREIKATLERQ